ncbi:MAG: hypothetical protein IJR68_04740 [Fretibacterium sp.]|nr:hypothetical protein [Fretibacterium sp.]
MFPVSRVMTSMRFALGDMQGARYSDHELVEAVNQAAALLYDRMGERFIHVALKRTVLVMNNGLAKLPGDFHNVYKVSVEGEHRDPATLKVCPVQYRIAGDTFYAPGDTYALEYYRTAPIVSNSTEVLDAPDSLRPFIERAALAMLGGDLAEANATAEACCKVHAGAEFSHLTDSGPVRVFGGRV